MTDSPVCPAQGGIETRTHVLAPLCPVGGSEEDAANLSFARGPGCQHGEALRREKDPAAERARNADASPYKFPTWRESTAGEGAGHGAGENPDAAGGSAATKNPLWDEAYRKGAEEARRQAEQEILRAAGALVKAAEQLQSRERSFVEQSQRDLLRLSLAIARQVVMAEMKTNPRALGKIVARLLDEAEDRKVVAVRLHPEDAERFNRSAAAETLANAGITVQSSPEVGPGGVILETGFGKLDARLETRLDEIAAALLGDSRVPADGRDEGLGLYVLPEDGTDAVDALDSPAPSLWEEDGATKEEVGESLWETQPAYFGAGAGSSAAPRSGAEPRKAGSAEGPSGTGQDGTAAPPQREATSDQQEAHT